MKEFAVTYLLESDVSQQKFFGRNVIGDDLRKTYDLRYTIVIVNITKSLRFLRIP